MVGYYSLIKKAVAHLDSDSPSESRRALYERARVAQLTQLRSISPPLSEAEITCEQEALEEAVSRVEAEAAPCARIKDLALDDLVPAADNIGKPLIRDESGSMVVQTEPRTHSLISNQTSVSGLPMTVTGGATGRLISYWRWRWRPLPRSRVA